MVECGQLECYWGREKSKGQAHGNQINSPKREIVCLGGGVLKAKVKRSATTDKRRYSESLATEEDFFFSFFLFIFALQTYIKCLQY